MDYVTFSLDDWNTVTVDNWSVLPIQDVGFIQEYFPVVKVVSALERVVKVKEFVGTQKVSVFERVTV